MALRALVTGGAFPREGTHNTGRSGDHGLSNLSAMVPFPFRTLLRMWLILVRVGCLSIASGITTRSQKLARRLTTEDCSS